MKIHNLIYQFQLKENLLLVNIDKENLDLPDLIENFLPSLAINSISLPSGIFLTISYKVCAGTVADPFSITEQFIVSVIEISISVADKTRDESVRF